MDYSSRLLQPLTINTNIVYDLDLSRFPGIDSQEHARQPALLIATPESSQLWQTALEHQRNHAEPETEVDLEASDDLFQLIESIAEVGSTEDSGYIQDFIDDVIDSTSSSSDQLTESFIWNLPDVDADVDADVDDLLLLNFLSNELPRYESLVTPDPMITRALDSTIQEEYPILSDTINSTPESQMVSMSSQKKRKRDTDLEEHLAMTFCEGYSCELEEYNRFG